MSVFHRLKSSCVPKPNSKSSLTAWISGWRIQKIQMKWEETTMTTSDSAVLDRLNALESEVRQILSLLQGGARPSGGAAAGFSPVGDERARALTGQSRAQFRRHASDCTRRLQRVSDTQLRKQILRERKDWLDLVSRAPSDA
jgi:hypothetical protein